MNSNNPHHHYQLGILIIAFVILLVGITLMYKLFMNPMLPTEEPYVTKDEIEKIYAPERDFDEDEKRMIESIYGN